MTRAYAEDLAYIHDAGFTDFARDAAPGLLQTLRRAGITHGRVVDLGCGSGVWARRLVQAGFDVLGIDQSAAMLALARRQAPRATFRRGSLWRANLPQCDAVTSLGECFNYLFDATAGHRNLAQIFRRVHDALRPGGLFIFDVAEPGRGSGPTMKHRTGKDWAVLVSVQEDHSRRVLTRSITAFRKVGRLYRRSEETHDLRLYRAPDLARQLRAVGFTVRIVRKYGTMLLPSGLAGFVARNSNRR